MGAGLGTGFAGLSAAAIISPMLITFLGFEPYEAVGIALASDVLASATSAYTYGKNKNLDITGQGTVPCPVIYRRFSAASRLINLSKSLACPRTRNRPLSWHRLI